MEYLLDRGHVGGHHPRYGVTLGNMTPRRLTKLLAKCRVLEQGAHRSHSVRRAVKRNQKSALRDDFRGATGPSGDRWPAGESALQ